MPTELKHIECSECESFTINVPEDVDFEAFLKSCDFKKCASCDGLLCDECGYYVDHETLCTECRNDAAQDAKTDHERSMTED